MIKTIHIELHAANPQLPLMPVEPFAGSAASFVICNVPRPIGNRTITGVSVNVTNVAGTQTSFAAVRNGSAWCATATAAAIGASGTVQNGVLIVASGKDDANNDASWIIGAGDLVVHATDGSVAPGVTRQTVYWFDTVPASPSKGAIAKVDGSVKIWDGTAWISMGGGGSGDVKHADFADVTAIGDRYGIADLKGKVNEMLGILKGTATAVALMLALASYGALETQTARLDALYNDSLIVTNATMTETDPTATAKAQAAIAAAGCVTTNESGVINYGVIINEIGGYYDSEVRSGKFEALYDGSWSVYGRGLPYYVYNGASFTKRTNYRSGGEIWDEEVFYLPFSDSWATALPAYRIARIADIPTDYIPAAGDTNSVAAILAAARTDSETISATAIANANTTYTPTNALVSLNQSVQYVEAGGTALTILAPTSVANGTRDWLVYVNATADTALNLAALPHIFVADAAYTNACAADKVTMLCFTEMTNNVFVIGRQELTAVK